MKALEAARIHRFIPTEMYTGSKLNRESPAPADEMSSPASLSLLSVCERERAGERESLLY